MRAQSVLDLDYQRQYCPFEVEYRALQHASKARHPKSCLKAQDPMQKRNCGPKTRTVSLPYQEPLLAILHQFRTQGLLPVHPWDTAMHLDNFGVSTSLSGGF